VSRAELRRVRQRREEKSEPDGLAQTNPGLFLDFSFSPPYLFT
jgi:hypothetical protein